MSFHFCLAWAEVHQILWKIVRQFVLFVDALFSYRAENRLPIRFAANRALANRLRVDGPQCPSCGGPRYVTSWLKEGLLAVRPERVKSVVDSVAYAVATRQPASQQTSRTTRVSVWYFYTSHRPKTM
jgi:hypothetical protein